MYLPMYTCLNICLFLCFSGLTNLELCATLDIRAHSEFRKLNDISKVSLHEASSRLKDKLILQSWLQEQGLDKFYSG